MVSIKRIRILQVPQIFAVVAIVAVVFVNATTLTAAEPLTYYGFDADSYSSEAHEGMEAIFSGACFHNGLPLQAVMAMITSRTGSKDELGYNPRSPEGQFFSSGQVPSPPNRKSGKAPGAGLGNSMFTRDGVMLANQNCFSCHAGVVNGQVIAGLGNSHNNQQLEFHGITMLTSQADDLMSLMPNDSTKKELTDMLSFISAAAGNLRHAQTRGENFGPYPVWRMGAYLIDPVNQGMMVGDQQTELSELFESTELPPVEAMAWWLMKYKETDYWYADANPYDAAHFSGNFTTQHPEVNESRAEHVKTVTKALAFARETQSPPFPESLDAALVSKGADLFHGRIKPERTSGFKTCKNCHGSYSRKESHSDLSIAGSWTVDYKKSKLLRDVKTDDAYNMTLQKFRPIAEHINKLEVYYAAKGTPELAPHAGVPKKAGYVAPPLVGVWATAPYFHNGSVPTIEAVLNSKVRPAIWSRNSDDPHAYNLDMLGLECQQLTESEFQQRETAAQDAHYLSKTAVDLASIYHTARFGRSNQGHTFGDNLTTSERTSIIEFLKSLSGPDMQ